MEQEWLDGDLGTPEEVASALRSIGAVNRLFGGNRTHTLLLRQIAAHCGRTRLHVLEVASGRGQVVAAAAQALRREQIDLEVTLLDLNRSHLPESWPAGLPQPRTLEGDALAIPLPEASVDVVSCCLFLHHLAPQQAALFLAEALRVARVAVLINDLERTPVHALLARLMSLVDPSRISRHDGPASVRQAYTRAEMRAMFRETGRLSLVRAHFLYRIGGILWARPESKQPTVL